MTSLVAGDATDMVPLPRSDGAKASLAKQLVAPAEVLADGQTVYNLYRGVICVCKNDVLARIWVDMSHMEVCVAKLDSSFIARFKVEDLVVRKTRSLLLVDSQKSPEVSPEDAPIDVAEIELEEESDTSYSLVFWASPEADAKDDAQSLKASGESNAPGRRRDELTVPGRPRLDNNGVERPTVVLHLRPPDQQYLSSDVLEEQMPGSRSGSKRRSEQSGGSSSSSSSTWRREGQRSAKTRPGGTGSSQLSSIREQSRESSRAEKKGSPQEEKEEAAGTSTDREERKDGLSNPQTTNYISAEQKAKPREQEAELSGTALHASTTNITTSLSTSALEESTPVLGSSSGVTTSLGGSVAVRPSQGDVELLPDHTESGTATPTAKNGGPGTGGPQAGRAFLNNMLDDDVCSSSTAAVPNLHTFLNNIRKLRGLVDTDAHAILHLQRNMFQYLWRFNAAAMTPDQLFSAQAVLAFNLDPKDGIAYLKDKVLRSNDVEPRRIGEWIAEMSAAGKGGIDPSILGRFFSRKDSLDIYTGFVDALDFSGLTITQAMRKLFDCFKPGGEGQVIDRIIKLFSDSYYQQVVTNYKKQRLAPRDPNEFPDWTSAESPYSFGFAIIMLNTDLHVMSKIMKKAGGGGKGEGSASMSLQQFIANTRCVLPAEEVSDAFLSHVYADIARAEIQLRPLPQAPLSSLPVAPDIEGWLTVVLPHGAQGVAIQRYWFSATAITDWVSILACAWM
ncbi:unnamed protein product [Amoebophrya sp. A25]|nr:unnamed protein product [Amoebophrya sp. A25]|eukprot:GSA25T00015977001.1